MSTDAIANAMDRQWLLEYRLYLTVGKDNSRKAEYESWKKELSETDPSYYTDAFRRLETAPTWKDLIAAMNDLGWTACDLLEHAAEFDGEDKRSLAQKLRQVHANYGHVMST